MENGNLMKGWRGDFADQANPGNYRPVSLTSVAMIYKRREFAASGS